MKRPQWQPDDDTAAFVVSVVDQEWFLRTMGKALHRGRVSVLYAVEDVDRRALRPDIKLQGEVVGW